MESGETLLAIEHIKRLKARYFRHVDAKEWPALEALFHPQAIFDRSSAYDAPGAINETEPGIGPDIVEGRSAIIAMVRKAVEPLHTVHQGFMPEITIESANTASAIWAMADELRDPDGTLRLAGRGHYHDRYALVNGEWLIVHSRLARLWLHRPQTKLEINQWI